MQEASHHGQVIREYKDSKAGITQEELARRIGKSRRTIINIEQSARIDDVKLRRTLAWALQIPPQLLGLSDLALPDMALLTPVDASESSTKRLSQIVHETFTDNIRMRLDLYYLGSSLAADRGLNSHIEDLSKLTQKGSSKDRHSLLVLLSHNYQLKGMIARDQLDYQEAERCFKQASLLAQEAECPELNALAMARRAVMCVWQKRLDMANSLYETAREISRRSPSSLRAFLATGHAEVQGMLGNERCLVSLTDARSFLGRVDPQDDHLLLLHSTRCSERSISDGWSNCHTLLGKPEIALDRYDKLEQGLDLSMTQMRARLYIQYAEALYVSKDMSCCFYATEGLKLARSVGSRYNVQRVKDLAQKLVARSSHDTRIKELLRLA